MVLLWSFAKRLFWVSKIKEHCSSEIQFVLQFNHSFVELSLFDWVTICKLAFVKLITRELSNFWSHPVLDVQHKVWDPTVQESFKHASTVMCSISVFWKDCGWKLLMISYQNNFLWIVTERYEIGQLNWLACFINDQILKVFLYKMTEHIACWHG